MPYWVSYSDVVAYPLNSGARNICSGRIVPT
jgi:hypothetical protein